VIEAFQVPAQNRIPAPTLNAEVTPEVPALVRRLDSWPWLRQFPARFVGLGPRPEHVDAPEHVKK